MTMPQDAPVLVTGATGNVGRALVDALVAAGQPVRAAVRDPAAEAGLPGVVEVVGLDFEDPATFGPAVAGCRGLFLLRPPAIAGVGPTLNRLVDAAAAAGVGHVVFLSVTGGARNPVLPHHRVERHLKGGSLPWTILRPGFFAQNLTGAYRADIRAGRLYVPAGSAAVAFVDTRDLGAAAAGILSAPSRHAGRAYDLTGPRTLTFSEVAELLSSVLGRPIRYTPATVRGYVARLRGQHVPTGLIAVQTVLHVDLRRGTADRVTPVLGALLGRPPTSMERFVADHAAQWAPEPSRAGP